MDFKKEPTLKEFKDIIDQYTNECMSPDGNIKSHTFPASISVWDDDDNSYPIKAVNLEYLIGCSCPCSIEIVVKKIDLLL